MATVGVERYDDYLDYLELHARSSPSCSTRC